MRVPRAGGAVLGAALLVALFPGPSQHAVAETFRACHDDTSFGRTNSHGSPINGTFGYAGAPFNHENAYYYLDLAVTSACVKSVDSHAHLLLQVTANGIGDLPGSKCNSSIWGPPCYPSTRSCITSCLSTERPQWGFEFKNSAGAILQPCAGGDGSGGNNCPSHPLPVVANPGGNTVSWRLDTAKYGQDYRVRIANLYDDVIWESARLDVVSCSTCFP